MDKHELDEIKQIIEEDDAFLEALRIVSGNLAVREASVSIDADTVAVNPVITSDTGYVLEDHGTYRVCNDGHSTFVEIDLGDGMVGYVD